MSLSLSNHSRQKLPVAQHVLQSVKNAVLGRSFELSIAFVSPAAIRRLNRIYRGKDAATDILSFTLDPGSGELVVCSSEARQSALRFSRPYRKFLLFLLIHGMLHLKGMQHGSRMESEERRFQKRFGI